jgi:hypothetical protein
MPTSYSLPALFQAAAHSKATHKKNVIALRQLAADSGSSTFQLEFFKMLVQTVSVKKGNLDAENILKFIKSYFDYLSQLGQPQGKIAVASRFQIK